MYTDHGIDLEQKKATQGSSIMIDFEIVMIKATQSVFRSASIKGCKFLLGQSWWRKI